MARQRAGQPVRVIFVRTTDAIHHAAKVQAAKERLTLEKLVERAIRKYLAGKRRS